MVQAKHSPTEAEENEETSEDRQQLGQYSNLVSLKRKSQTVEIKYKRGHPPLS
jgi:hypothetical protein